MANVTARVHEGNLIISIPMNKVPESSKTGKTKVVASSHGNQPTTLMVDGAPVIIGVNAYIKQ